MNKPIDKFLVLVIVMPMLFIVMSLVVVEYEEQHDNHKGKVEIK